MSSEKSELNEENFVRAKAFLDTVTSLINSFKQAGYILQPVFKLMNGHLLNCLKKHPSYIIVLM
jgi:hypothetical protein